MLETAARSETKSEPFGSSAAMLTAAITSSLNWTIPMPITLN